VSIRDDVSLLGVADPLHPFGTIVADPPWPSRSIPAGQPRSHWLKENMKPRYNTMSADDLLHLPVTTIAAPDAVLVVWATWMHLDLAFRLIPAWGFRYSTGMPWLKVCKDGINPIYGPGPWFQHCTEIVLIARRGKPFGANGNPRPARKGIIVAPRSKHSRKPAELQNWIDSHTFPEPKLEMFATQTRPGWTSWGTDI
jgi:N6-adenosine-specific RNA methylase IME4